MTRGRRSECREHRQALLALVIPELRDGTQPSPPDPRALAHLATCRRCRADIEALRLASFRIRRDLAPAEPVETGQDAWPMIRARVTRPPAGSPAAARPHVGGVLAAGLAVALLVAVVGPQHPQTFDEPGARPAPVEQPRSAAVDAGQPTATGSDGPAPAAPITQRPQPTSALTRVGESASAGEALIRVSLPAPSHRAE